MIDPKIIDDHLARTLKIVEQYDWKIQCAMEIRSDSAVQFFCLMAEAGTELREAIATASLELIDKMQKDNK